MKTQAFVLFSFSHVFALLFIACLALIFPLFYRNSLFEKKEKIANILAIALISLELIKPFISYYLGNSPWIKVLPLHMCNLSSFFLGFFLLMRKRILFDISFFLGIGGGMVAFLTPDISHDFPHRQYLLFFLGHGLFMVGIAYTCIALKNRPTLKSLKNVIFFSLLILPFVYLINKALGAPANYWYLGMRPEGQSLMSYFPEPPLHIPFLIVLGIVQFCLMYLPFWVYDKSEKS